ncbi:Protein unc-13-like protein A, partial [Frankliniella fusca]
MAWGLGSMEVAANRSGGIRDAYQYALSTLHMRLGRLWSLENELVCEKPFRGAFNSLPNNHSLLRMIEARRSGAGRAPPPLSWCFSCGAAAAPGCGAGHEVLPAGEALRRELRGVMREGRFSRGGVLPQAAGELLDESKAKQALQALALLTADSCDVTVRVGDLELTGTVSNTEDPLVKSMWLVLADKAALTQKPVSKQQKERPAAPVKEPPAAPAKEPPAAPAKEPPAAPAKEPPAAPTKEPPAAPAKEPPAAPAKEPPARVLKR